MEVRTNIAATCPECRGPLTEYSFGDAREYHCLVGHAYTFRSVLQAHSETQEKALWAAVVALEEAANLVEAVKADFPPEIVERLERQAAAKVEQAGEIRRILQQREPFTTGS